MLKSEVEKLLRLSTFLVRYSIFRSLLTRVLPLWFRCGRSRCDLSPKPASEYAARTPCCQSGQSGETLSVVAVVRALWSETVAGPVQTSKLAVGYVDTFEARPECIGRRSCDVGSGCRMVIRHAMSLRADAFSPVLSCRPIDMTRQDYREQTSLHTRISRRDQ